MGEMIERVARAICRIDGYDPDSDPNNCGGPVFTAMAFPDGWRKWNTYERQARTD